MGIFFPSDCPLPGILIIRQKRTCPVKQRTVHLKIKYGLFLKGIMISRQTFHFVTMLLHNRAENLLRFQKPLLLICFRLSSEAVTARRFRLLLGIQNIIVAHVAHSRFRVIIL